MKVTLSVLYQGGKLQFTHPTIALTELFYIAKELKFDGVDYILTIPEVLTSNQNTLLLSKQYKIPILGVHSPMHILFFTPSILFQLLINVMRNFPDSEVYNFHLSGFIHPLQKNRKNLEKFVALAKNNNVSLSFESNPLLVGLQYYPRNTYDPELFAEYCITHNLSITFDTAHVAHCGYNIVTFFRKYHQQIKLIHLSDSRGSIQHLPLGKGDLPIKELLQEIKRKSYNQVLTFEISNFPKETSTKQKTEEIRKSFDMVKRYSL